MAKRKSIFTKTREEMVSLSVKVPKTTKERADRLMDELKLVDPSLSFNTSKILQNAYEDAIRDAEQELAKMQNRKRGVGPARRPATGADTVGTSV